MANAVYEISLLKKCLCTIPKKHQNALPAGKNCFDSLTTSNAIKRTALHVAARNGHHACTKALIAASNEGFGTCVVSIPCSNVQCSSFDGV
jgi:ankyrin repeat protein